MLSRRSVVHLAAHPGFRRSTFDSTATSSGETIPGIITESSALDEWPTCLSPYAWWMANSAPRIRPGGGSGLQDEKCRQPCGGRRGFGVRGGLLRDPVRPLARLV